MVLVALFSADYEQMTLKGDCFLGGDGFAFFSLIFALIHIDGGRDRRNSCEVCDSLPG